MNCPPLYNKAADKDAFGTIAENTAGVGRLITWSVSGPLFTKWVQALGAGARECLTCILSTKYSKPRYRDGGRHIGECSGPASVKKKVQGHGNLTIYGSWSRIWDTLQHKLNSLPAKSRATLLMLIGGESVLGHHAGIG